jgi:hypothetical protein
MSWSIQKTVAAKKRKVQFLIKNSAVQDRDLTEVRALASRPVALPVMAQLPSRW